jgi:hypothetical protein
MRSFWTVLLKLKFRCLSTAVWAIADVELLSRAENPLYAIPKFPLWADISIESDALDPELFAQIGNGSIALCHGGLGEAHLRFGESKLACEIALNSNPESTASTGINLLNSLRKCVLARGHKAPFATPR